MTVSFQAYVFPKPFIHTPPLIRRHVTSRVVVAAKIKINKLGLPKRIFECGWILTRVAARLFYRKY
jgi:hypothetical protein